MAAGEGIAPAPADRAVAEAGSPDRRPPGDRDAPARARSRRVRACLRRHGIPRRAGGGARRRRLGLRARCRALRDSQECSVRPTPYGAALAAGAEPPLLVDGRRHRLHRRRHHALRRGCAWRRGSARLPARAGPGPAAPGCGARRRGPRRARARRRSGEPARRRAALGARPGVVQLLAGLPGPPFELSHALQQAIDAGLAIAGVEIGPTRDLTHAVDLVKENFHYLAP